MKSMDKNGMFFLLNGNNGATYIINVNNLDNLKRSLNFYKARTLKQFFLKKSLFTALFILSFVNLFIRLKCFKPRSEIIKYIKLIGCNINLQLDNDCSLLISPTRDKIIVNHHNKFFHKIAFSSSYNNVKRESDIYRLIAGRAVHFSISNIFDFFDDGVAVCSFKMHPPTYVKQAELSSIELVLPLLDFFNFSKGEKADVLTLASQLNVGVTHMIPDSKLVISQYFEKLKFYGHYELKLGLVHGDFKPWNILAGFPVVFFDFEEATLYGLPLEDLFNYIIDPEIRYIPVEDMAGLVFNSVNVQAYRNYLHRLGCEVSYLVLLYLYLLGRIQFWSEQGQVDTALRYLALLKFIDNSENALNG